MSSYIINLFRYFITKINDILDMKDNFQIWWRHNFKKMKPYINSDYTKRLIWVNNPYPYNSFYVPRMCKNAYSKIIAILGHCV